MPGPGSARESQILGDRGPCEVRTGTWPRPGWGRRGQWGTPRGQEWGHCWVVGQADTLRGLPRLQALALGTGHQGGSPPPRRGSVSLHRTIQTLATVPQKAREEGSPAAGSVCSPAPRVPWAHSCWGNEPSRRQLRRGCRLRAGERQGDRSQAGGAGCQPGGGGEGRGV